MHFLKLWLKATPNKKPSALPHAIRKLGKEDIKLKDGSVHYKGLEVITDDERKQKILAKEDSAYGGSKAIYYRLRKHYLGTWTWTRTGTRDPNKRCFINQRVCMLLTNRDKAPQTFLGLVSVPGTGPPTSKLANSSVVKHLWASREGERSAVQHRQ